MPEQGRPHAWLPGSHQRPGAAEATHGVLVEAFMTRPVLSVPADVSVELALVTMRARGVHHLLLEDRGRIVAIVSDRDLHRSVSPRAGTGTARRDDDATLLRPVFQVASYGMVTVPLSATIEEAAALILERGISALPVTDGEHGIIGMITSRDLLRGLLSCVLPSAPALTVPPAAP